MVEKYVLLFSNFTFCTCNSISEFNGSQPLISSKLGVLVISSIILKKQEIKGQMTHHIINLYVKWRAVYSLPFCKISWQFFFYYMLNWMCKGQFWHLCISVFMFLQPFKIFKKRNNRTCSIFILLCLEIVPRILYTCTSTIFFIPRLHLVDKCFNSWFFWVTFLMKSFLLIYWFPRKLAIWSTFLSGGLPICFQELILLSLYFLSQGNQFQKFQIPSSNSRNASNVC